MSETSPPPAPADEHRPLLLEMRTKDDWWAIWLGALILAVVFFSIQMTEVPGKDGAEATVEATSALKPWIVKPSSWNENPLDSLSKGGKSLIPGMLAVGAAILAMFAVAQLVMGKSVPKFALGFLAVFPLALLAYLLSTQEVIKYYNLEYALWALLVGLIISNTIGTPGSWKPAVLTEFYIKTGLVLLGAEVLLAKLFALSVPGIAVAWIVTPIVLITTFIFGQKILRMASPSLNMVISADMSVCGVSAAIATGAACRAKKEELSLAIGMSLAFTVIMMVVQPALIRIAGIDDLVGGAWIGGTIDATGAVVAAGNALGERAEKVAVTVKMIQNVLIGVVAFGVALYWVAFVEKTKDGARPNAMEIWYRFPKFVLGFVAASVVFSAIAYFLPTGEAEVKAMTDMTKSLRGWLFCLAFVSIGLETNFRELAVYLKGGKPLILYVCGQTLNLLLTFLMAYVMFGWLFRDYLEKMFNGGN
ncbi:YeiH family protein [Blastopirellula sp. JC732]|uniref:YeiH family protein n=1 Tax=Blastopirellula sediminis TaxID=2894196 RepID=A0A9X1MJY3_9BACT|nr:putative sulfate exporter family transporter [Blastopirellula sediminis]MCC9608690.1 YeiH family protein [Blastopirellula sediminis]MCC9628533.1 YeiH family protein [Blastopirellula sediminis]